MLKNKDTRRVTDILLVAGGLAMVAGAAVYFVRPGVAPWIYAPGVAAYAAARLAGTGFGREEDLTRRRLRTLTLLSVVLYVAVAVLLFRESGLWPLVLLCGAVADLYLAIRKAALDKKR